MGVGEEDERGAAVALCGSIDYRMEREEGELLRSDRMLLLSCRLDRSGIQGRRGCHRLGESGGGLAAILIVVCSSFTRSVPAAICRLQVSDSLGELDMGVLQRCLFFWELFQP